MPTSVDRQPTHSPILQAARVYCREVFALLGVSLTLQAANPWPHTLQAARVYSQKVFELLHINHMHLTLQAARVYCREVFELLRTLKATRDMSVNEVKLVISIEDPRTKASALVLLLFHLLC